MFQTVVFFFFFFFFFNVFNNLNCLNLVTKAAELLVLQYKEESRNTNRMAGELLTNRLRQKYSGDIQ